LVLDSRGFSRKNKMFSGNASGPQTLQTMPEAKKISWLAVSSASS